MRVNPEALLLLPFRLVSFLALLIPFRFHIYSYPANNLGMA